MEFRNACHPKDVKNYTTDRLREEFLIQNIFVPGKTKLVYSYIDRIITAGVCPLTDIDFDYKDEVKADYFLQRREMGVINIGGEGKVSVDGKDYTLKNRDGLYIGMGNENIVFKSNDQKNLAKFYISSAPAHKAYPVEMIDSQKIEIADLGSQEQCNKRTLAKYIHPDGVKSCQLVMGLTAIEPGSVWNTMPCHTHARRMEVYLYFNVSPESVLFHFMGEPSETRHIIVRNEEAVISPSWSIHSAAGTGKYMFIWAMVGENQQFTDMDAVPMSKLK